MFAVVCLESPLLCHAGGVEEKILGIMIGAFQSLRASNRIGNRVHKDDPEKTGYGENSYGDKPKISPACWQLDRTIVDKEANLVVQDASAKVVMPPAGMADGEATQVELLGSFSDGFNRTRHGGAP